MPNNFDSDAEVSAEQKTGSSKGADTQQDDSENIEELKKRYSGQTRTVENQRKLIDKLRAEHDAEVAQYEQDLSELRAKVKGQGTESNDWKTKAEAAAAERDALNAKLAARDLKDKVRGLVEEKFQPLLPMFRKDLLRSPSEFEDDEKFEAYLSEVAGMVAPTATETPTQQRVEDALRPSSRIPRGATPPPPPPPPRQKGTSKRSAAEISDEMLTLDPRNPAHQARYNQLFDELNESV